MKPRRRTRTDEQIKEGRLRQRPPQGSFPWMMQQIQFEWDEKDTVCAKRLELTHSTWSGYKLGRIKPSRPAVDHLATVSKYSLRELLNGVKIMKEYYHYDQARNCWVPNPEPEEMELSKSPPSPELEQKFQKQDLVSAVREVLTTLTGGISLVQVDMLPVERGLRELARSTDRVSMILTRLYASWEGKDLDDVDLLLEKDQPADSTVSEEEI